MQKPSLVAILAVLCAAPTLAQDAHVNAGTYHSCGLTGDAKATNVFDLNKLKNRATTPTSINATVDAAWMMQPSQDDTGRFDESWAATIRLFVTDAKVGGVETVNCHATDPRYRDTHIEGNAVGATYTGQPMIVEVTPRWRATMK